MLSGIGEKKQLDGLEIKGPCDAAGEKVCDVVEAAEVGANLQDRYEVTVISEMRKGVRAAPGRNL